MRFKFKYCIILFLLTQNIFCQNNLIIGNAIGINNTQIEIPVIINNTDNFTGFQFDVTLPSNVTYVNNSIIQSSRFVNHSINASLINSTTIRFIAYSPNNTNFTGNSGEIFRFKITPNLSSATYPISISNAIITNISAINILNNTTNGSLQILNNINTNEIIIGNSSGNNYSEIEISVSLNNSQLINAFQFDIALPNNINYVTNSIITSNRFAGHTISASIINGTILRFLAYSANNSNFIGNSGEMFRFKLRPSTTPGIYPLNISNGIISNLTYGNVITNSTNGNLQVLISNEINTLSLGNSSGYNNTEIEIPVSISNSQEIQTFQFDIVIPNGVVFTPNSIVKSSRLINHNVTSNMINQNTIRFIVSPQINQNLIGNLGEVFRFKLTTNINPGIYPLYINNPILSNINFGNIITNQSDGQLEIITQSNINLITIGTVTGENNSQITIPVSIENSQQFNGFQFDLTLPNNTTFIDGSILFGNRNTNHIISSNLINSNTIRFICYSPNNDWFTGNNGVVFYFNIITNLPSGSYPIIISNIIISNTVLGNIYTNSNNGIVNINSSELIISPTAFQLGDIPINQPHTIDVTFENSGNSNITISSFNCPNWIINSSPLPITIPPFTTINIPFILTPSNLGALNQNILVNQNGNSNTNLINILANVVSSNYLKIIDKTVLRNSSDIVNLNLINSNSIRAIQFDINFPSGFILNNSNIQPSSIISNFSISSNILANGNYRFVIYSLNSSIIPQGNNLLLSLPIYIQNSVALGDYQFTISNVILSNSNNQNCYSNPLSTGIIHVVDNIVNTPPIAQNDNINTYIGCNSSILIGNISSLLANDYDADGNTLTALLNSPTSHGNITINTDGTFTYINDGTNNQFDSFTYIVNDGLVNSNIATVYITLNPQITPLFNQVAPICSGNTLAALPTTSNNSITGTWFPEINNTSTTTYTFTPNSDQCANTTTMTIQVSNISAPTGLNLQTLLDGQTIGDIVVTGQNIIWYASESDAISQINSLPSNTILVDGETYYATQTINNCTSQSSFSVTINLTLNLPIIIKNNLIFFPNPVENNFYFESDTMISKIEIKNILNQLIIAKNYNSLSGEINLSILKSGNYIFTIYTEEGQKNIKIIKN